MQFGIQFFKRFLITSVICVTFSCDDDPLCIDDGPTGSTTRSGSSSTTSCSSQGSLPSKHQWFTIYGIGAPHYYGDAELLGLWKAAFADFEFTLKSDGTGSWHFLGGGFSPAKTTPIKWGVQVNKSDCKKVGDPQGWYVDMVDAATGELIDPQFGSSGYVPGTKKWTNGYTR